MSLPAALRGYYAILDLRAGGAGSGSGSSSRAEELLAARPCCLQLRAKRLGAAALLALARVLVPLCRRPGCPSA